MTGDVNMDEMYRLEFSELYKEAFNGFIAGRRGTTQTDDIGALNRKDHIGFAVYVDFTAKMQNGWYVNTKGETVAVYNPFVESASETGWPSTPEQRKRGGS